MMPRNSGGKPIRARDFNYSDGFSPGQTIVTRVPGLDTPKAFRRTGAVPVTDMSRSFERRQPVVVINARTRRRQLIWAELDAYADRPRDVTLNIHPGANWREGERYIVALRRLRDARGRVLGARRAFRVYRDRLPARSRPVERRRRHMESIFGSLRAAGIPRRDLYLAWDFTVATPKTLASRLLSIRDRAFALLGDTDLDDLRVEGRAPSFAVGSVDDGNPDIRRVTGTFEVPCFLDRPGCPPGARFVLGRRGLPLRTPGNTQEANFTCLLPRSGTPVRPLVYGHGLFGSAEEVDSLEPLVRLLGFAVCGTDWSGMSRGDLPNVADLSRDLSRFSSLADRLQQGALNFMFLGRLLLHPQGLASNPAFGNAIDRRRLFFAGGSQGGILGGALTAVAPDFTRAALVVPAMNYSLLLPRSSQFATFSEVLFPSYPDQLERPLLLSLIQLLWDRGEANGYAWHMTRDPYRNTPLHSVLLHQAFGDHQVANVATEVEARVIGARLRTPALDPGRSADRRPYYRIPRIPAHAVRRQRAGRRSTSARSGVRWARRRRPRPAFRRRLAWTRTASPRSRSPPRCSSPSSSRRAGPSWTPAARSPATPPVGTAPERVHSGRADSILRAPRRPLCLPAGRRRTGSGATLRGRGPWPRRSLLPKRRQRRL